MLVADEEDVTNSEIRCSMFTFGLCCQMSEDEVEVNLNSVNKIMKRK